MTIHYRKQQINYKTLHIIANRAMPNMFCEYKLVHMLNRPFNHEIPRDEWTEPNFNQVLTSRQTHFRINLNNLHVVWKNALANRFHDLNDIIDQKLLNLNLNSYKIACTTLFLKNFK
jgi:hypothetical protein